YIAWETSSAQQGAVLSYGPAAGRYTSALQESGSGTRHHVQLTGLLPATTYHFIIDSDAAGEDSQLTTAPEAASPARFRFAVYGDNRTQPGPHQRVVAALQAEKD